MSIPRPLRPLTDSNRQWEMPHATRKPSSSLLKRTAENTLNHPPKRQKVAYNFFTITMGDAPYDICRQILTGLDPEAFMNCARINDAWNKIVKSVCARLSQSDLIRICPKLTIIDAAVIKIQRGIEILEEPLINNFEVIKCARDLASHVLNNKGVTLLTIPSEFDIDASLLGLMGVELRIINRLTVPKKLQKISSAKTHRIIITNNILIGSQDTNIAAKWKTLKGLKSRMPTTDNYAILCTLSYEIFRECFYQAEKGHRGQSSSQTSSGRKNHNIAVAVAVYTTSGTPDLKTYTCTSLSGDKLGVGACRILPPPSAGV